MPVIVRMMFNPIERLQRVGSGAYCMTGEGARYRKVIVRAYKRLCLQMAKFGALFAEAASESCQRAGNVI